MWLFWLACAPSPSFDLDTFRVEFADDGSFSVSKGDWHVDDLRVFAGAASGDVTMQFGSFHWENVVTTATPVGGVSRKFRGSPPRFELADAEGTFLGTLSFAERNEDTVSIQWAPAAGASYAGFSAACVPDDHFMGLGSHAYDVDHVGEAFRLFTTEPGIGKTDTDEWPSDGFLRGTRHATSYPMPFALRPQLGQGILLETTAPVDVDLCATDADRFQMGAWQSGELVITLVKGDDALSTVQHLTDIIGRAPLAQPWVFAPWNDAIRGPERVREVADKLRAAGAPSTVIWSEDWKGAEDVPQGYHLTGEWFLDETKYPQADALAAELEAKGFKWFAYFSPFLTEGTATYDDAVAQGVTIKTAEGNPYLFPGVTFEPTSMVDLSTSAGQGWARGYMTAALDHGFDGWMTDYAEWLPTDAFIGSGESALEAHNEWPLYWQETNLGVMEDRDASFFVRSGWTQTSAMAPVVWVGDQRTSFDTDDGYPTVLPLILGLSAGGVPVATHDVGGYQSIGNAPTTRELFYRWASLGAYTPVMRTHHGAFAADNWQFDHDEETLAFWARVTREHMRLYPYRYALAAKAAADGTPMVLPVAFRYGDDWARMDAWLLGAGMLVAPVLTEGAVGREVTLPDDVAWYSWSTRASATSGFVAADVEEIPVFIAAGSIIPTFKTIPDTLVEAADPQWVNLADADAERVLYVFGAGGVFTEADGTTYTLEGAPTASAEATQTLSAGEIAIGGAVLHIDGPTERTYTVIVTP